jgi:protoheme ferro-lyase
MELGPEVQRKADKSNKKKKHVDFSPFAFSQDFFGTLQNFFSDEFLNCGNLRI